jgi:D-alanine-D-alanine ligase
MGSHDCIVLYNAAVVSDREDCEEETNPAYILREDVGAVEESLRELGFRPYVFSVERFSRDLIQVLLDVSPKFVFNLCEEIDGNSELEMYAAGLLELMEIPYTGSKPLALGLALNKFHVKQILRSAGIPTPRGYPRSPERKSPVPRGMRVPVIVKPAHEDASLGINSHSVCRTANQIEKQIQYIHNVYQQEALVEEYLEGREFNVSIMEQNNPEVLAISEIDFSGLPEGEPKIVSYRAKWDEESPLFHATIPICPANLSKRLENRIRYIAIRSYQCIGCRDYARVDMRTDSRGNLYVLEVNPNPDISPKAGFARAARAAGYSYSEMIQRISGAAMARRANIAPAVYAF